VKTSNASKCCRALSISSSCELWRAWVRSTRTASPRAWNRFPKDLLKLNQGTLYPALIRLEQQGRIKGKWDNTENGREAKFYAITKAGTKALGEETQRWRQMSGLVEKLLGEES
jgi:hypothetical protein